MTTTETSRSVLTLRPDFATIAAWIKPGSSVLDLGCGDGTLLHYLSNKLNVRGYGVEISAHNILACMQKGINVIHSDLESGLSGFENESFDYVILSQTLQAMKNTENIIQEISRVGKEGIVSFPNFGYWKNRLQVASGHMPVSSNLPYQWYDTPNIHLCTLHDFEQLCRQHKINILERQVMNHDEKISLLPNFFGILAFYRFGHMAS
ncbi:methionine biosynthesis protein MetW [Nitrosomonas sp.]|uniref:methionine biosynthesis protein MetW n=1 Tax=Nitrosomonas sp. TaxID=42353 RepID=UPI0025EEE115|nr:methionine biosynthesis protein MetW [Nitrosomonas sp.]